MSKRKSKVGFVQGLDVVYPELPLMQDKYQNLLAALRKYRRAAVAFSGGVDSTLLLYAAREAIGAKNVVAARAVSKIVSEADFLFGNLILDEMCVAVENRLEMQHNILDLGTFVSNSPKRCYHCKSLMYSSFQYLLQQKEPCVLLDGTNSDDLLQLRPGQQAIVELSVVTPLADVGLTKCEIRALARTFSLRNHDKLSNSCLATRIAGGSPITQEKLKWIERCEYFLIEHGFSGCRVRLNENSVVVEVEKRDFNRLQETAVRSEIVRFFLGIGCEQSSLKFAVRCK